MTPYVMLLIPMLPLASGVIIGSFRRRLGENSAKVGVPSAVLSFILSLWMLYTVSMRGAVRITVLPALSSDERD